MQAVKFFQMQQSLCGFFGVGRQKEEHEKPIYQGRDDLSLSPLLTGG